MNADMNVSYRPESSPGTTAARLTGIYLTLATIWLVSSDRLVGEMFTARVQQLLQTSKGMVFILATALTLFLIQRRALSRLMESEQRLEAANARLRALLEASPMGFVAHDGEGRVQYWNGAAERLFGWKTAEVLNQPDPVLPEAELEHLFDSVGEGAGTGVELRRRRRDGSMVDVVLSLGCYRAAGSGPQTRVILVSALVGEQLATNKLKRFQLLAEHCDDLILFTNDEGRILDANQAAAAAYGYDRDELIGYSLQRLNGDEPSAPSRTGLAPHGRVVEVTRRRKDGTCLPTEIRQSRMQIDGESTVMEIGRDLTQRRRSEAIRALMHQTERSILNDDSQEQILTTTCQSLAQVFGLPLVWISIKQPDGSLRLAARGGPSASLLDMILDSGTGPLDPGGPKNGLKNGLKERGTDRLRISRHDGPGDLEKCGERLKSLGLPSLFSVALVAADRPIGALFVTSSRRHAFDEEIATQLAQLADQISQAITTTDRRDQLSLRTLAVESAPYAVVIFDRDRRITWVNRAFTTLTGYSRDEVIGTPSNLLEANHQPASFYQHIWQSLREGQTWHGEQYCRRKDGTLYLEDQTLTPVKLHDDSISHFIALKRDITERSRQDEQIRYLAMHDGLTDLPNRRSLEQHVEQAVIHARATRPGALVLLDVDNFKVVNELGGHIAGDQLLVTLANLFNRGVPANGFLARVGSDEFAVLLDETTPAEARAIAEQMMLEVNELRFTLNETLFPLSASLGITTIDGHSAAQCVLGMADTALYTAKHRGKNRIVRYQGLGRADAELAEAGQWAIRIKDALRENRMVLYFQPVVDLNTGRANHFEALIRMRDNKGQVIAPGLFIPAAERFGLMPQIDYWVTSEVLKVLHKYPHLRIFMNLSGQSLGDDDLLEFISSRVRESGIVPGHLVFELTETVALADLMGAQHWMRSLRNLGCQFALDDFGSGFSAFSYLRALPADYVKIDGSFIRNIDTDTNNRALVQAITTVAHALGKEVIAEWVESPHIAGILRQLGIEHGQGYYWGAPTPLLPSGDLVFSVPDRVEWAEAS